MILNNCVTQKELFGALDIIVYRKPFPTSDIMIVCSSTRFMAPSTVTIDTTSQAPPLAPPTDSAPTGSPAPSDVGSSHNVAAPTIVTPGQEGEEEGAEKKEEKGEGQMEEEGVDGTKAKVLFSG